MHQTCEKPLQLVPQNVMDVFFSRGELTAYDVQNGQDGEACSLPEDVASLVFIYEEPQVD